MRRVTNETASAEIEEPALSVSIASFKLESMHSAESSSMGKNSLEITFTGLRHVGFTVRLLR
jgi:hypothetical protein